MSWWASGVHRLTTPIPKSSTGTIRRDTAIIRPCSAPSVFSVSQVPPSSRREMALIGPIVSNEVFFFVAILALAGAMLLMEYRKRRATLDDVVRHIRYWCDLIGDARHIGLGTDMDGGLGREEIPSQITTSADLPRVADALAAADFGDADVRAIMGANWIEFFRRSLGN